MASSSEERKNCANSEQAEQDAGPDGAVALADQDLVEDGQDERQQHERRGHQVGELEARQDEGREAVEQAADEGGRGPGGPAPDDDEGGERGERRRDGRGHVERRDRAPDPRDGHQRQAQPGDRRLRQQVDPGRVEERGREERVLPVGQRGGRPLEEPQEEGGVAAAAQGVGGGALRPRRAPTGRTRARDTPRPPRRGSSTVATDRCPCSAACSSQRRACLPGRSCGAAAPGRPVRSTPPRGTPLRR